MATETCDVVVIGSGAAGGVLAATIAELTDLRIVLLERGPFMGSESFNQREEPMGRLLQAEKGRRRTADGAIPVRGGECVGGGTTINYSLALDPLPSVWENWRNSHGLEGFSFDPAAADYGIPELNMAVALGEVKDRLGVKPAPDAWVNDNNRMFERGCRVLGITAKRFPLNIRDCRGCGYCGQGCAYDRKQSVGNTYLTDALARGVKLIHHCEVERIFLDWRRRATGVSARVRPTIRESRENAVAPGPLRIRARLVILAAGAIATPEILYRSHHPDPHRRIGRGLVLHPAVPIIALLDHAIENYRGTPGTIYSDHFYETGGFYLECLFSHPVYGAVVLPGFGEEHFDLLRSLERLAACGAMLIDSVDHANRVQVTPSGVQIRYQLTEGDRQRLRTACRAGVEVMLAAGAREVVLPSEERIGTMRKARFRTAADAEACAELQFIPHRTTVTSAHCQASTKMSSDPRFGVADSRGESHFVENLIICDSSSFPESCGTNPMLSIMAMARYQGRRIAAEWDRRYERPTTESV
jgi:choline dehydrogenase-like flavoprotein